MSLMISVVLPVKDGELSSLKRAISTLEKQTFQNYELLLVDDGSEDSFSKELDSIAASEPKIRLFHISPSGVSDARNYALKKAQGDVITFLDADDMLTPYCFEEAVTILDSRPDTDALFGGAMFIDENGLEEAIRQTPDLPHSPDELNKLIVELTADRIHQTRAECIGTPYYFEGGYINRGIAARFIRKRVFSEDRYFFPSGLKLYEDTIWNLEMINHLQILYVCSVWYYYFNNASSASNRYHPDLLTWIEPAILRVRDLSDTEDPVEFNAYALFMLDSVGFLYRCFYGHPDWKPSKQTKQEIKKHLYSSEPWLILATPRFRSAVEKKDRLKSLMYQNKLLLSLWDIKRP